MSRPLPIRVVDSAARVIKDAAAWWIVHRDKAPDAFTEELERVFN